MRRSIIMPGLAGVFLSLASVIPARAGALTVIPQPTAAYTSSTTLIDVSKLTGDVDSITADGLTVNFSTAMSVLGVGVDGGWGTWNKPPATETDTPTVLYGKGANDVVMTLTKPISIFGFEAQPDLSDIEVMKATYYDAANTSLGNVTLNVSGNVGALLFAVSSSLPDIAKIDLTDLGPKGTGCAACDFAIAEVRFATIPEPGSFFLAGLGMIIVGALPVRGLCSAVKKARQTRTR